MHINARNFSTLLSVIISSVCFYSMASRPELVQIEGTYSIVYSSPLTSGSNSSNLLKGDLTRPPDCITTLGIGTSWLLVDLGFVVQGIVQLRLYGDIYNEDTHDNLSDLEIKMAETIPYKNITNFDQFELSTFKTCGNTGTVSKYTFNVVIDCKSVFNVRWILFHKKKTLNICHINVLQNAVQPQCFYRLFHTHEFYSTITSNLEVFRSMRMFTPLGCFKTCDSEEMCEGIAFLPYSTDTGICQLLKIKTSISNLFCDNACQVSINVCHLGQKIYAGSSTKDGVMKLESINADSIILSIEITGELSCHGNNCGNTAIFIVDDKDKASLCWNIDPLKYRVLIKRVFLCKTSVINPRKLILKTESKNPKYSYRFTSIYLRTATENSFILDLRKQFKSPGLFSTSTTIISTRSYKIATDSWKTFKSQETENSNPKIPNSFFISSRTTSEVSPTTVPYESSSSTKSTFSTRKTSRLFKVITLNNRDFTYTEISSILNHNSTTFTERDSPKVTTTSTTSKANIKIDNALLATDKTGNISKVEKLTQPMFNTQNKEYTTSKIIVNDTQIFKENNNVASNISTNTSQSFNNIFLNSASAPYIWIILVIFLSILVTVTLIVLLITFLDGRRKRKEWDIPAYGLCPLDPESERVTLESSLHDSTIRKVS